MLNATPVAYDHCIPIPDFAIAEPEIKHPATVSKTRNFFILPPEF